MAIPFIPDILADSLEVYIGTAGTGRATMGSTTLDMVVFAQLPGQPSASVFTPADVGMPIAIVGGGPVNPAMPAINFVQGSTFVTTVAAYVGPGQVTLAAAPDTSIFNTGFCTIVCFRPCPIANSTSVAGTSFAFDSSIAPGTRDSLNFSVLAQGNPYIERFTTIANGQNVYFRSTDSSVGEIFGGLIDSLQIFNYPGLTGQFMWTAQCASWAALASRRQVPPAQPGTFSGTGDVVFTDLVLTYLQDDGVGVIIFGTPGTVSITAPVGAYINQLLDQMCADLSTPDLGWFWTTDAWRNYILSPYTQTNAPWTPDNGGGDFFAGDTPIQVSLLTTHNQVANLCYALGQNVLLNALNATFQGDGTNTTFNTPQKLGGAPTITLNGNPQTVGIQGIDTGDNWYWAQGSTAIVQDAGGAILASTDLLLVAYATEVPGVAESPNEAGLLLANQTEATAGVYNGSTQVTQAITPAALLDIAEAQSTGYGLEGQTVAASTLRPGLATGQLQAINFPAAGIDGTFLIATVHLTENANVLQWDYTAFAGANVGTAITGLVQFINRDQGTINLQTPTVAITGPAVPPISGNFASGLAGAGVSSPLPFPNTVTKGNVLVVIATRNNLGATTVMDSLGNAYTLAVAAANPGPFANVAAIFWTISGSSGPCSVTCTAANYIAIAELPGIDQVSPVDSTGSHSGIGPAIAVANANNVVVTGMCMDSSSAVPTATAPEIVFGYSLLGGPASDCAGALETVPTAGTFTSTLASTATNPIYVSVSFNRAPATAPPSQTVDVAGNPAIVPVATTSIPGIVQPDGTSITISGGVISSSGGGGGGVAPNPGSSAPTTSVPFGGWAIQNQANAHGNFNDFLPNETVMSVGNYGTLQWSGLTRSLPGATYTLIATIELRGQIPGNINTLIAAVCISDGTNYEQIEVVAGSTTANVIIQIRTMSSLSTAGTVLASSSNTLGAGLTLSIKVVNDGTHRTWSYWLAGAWTQFYQEATGTFLTETKAGITGLSDVVTGGYSVDVALRYWSAV